MNTEPSPGPDRTEAINELIKRWIEKNKMKEAVPVTETADDAKAEDSGVSG